MENKTRITDIDSIIKDSLIHSQKLTLEQKHELENIAGQLTAPGRGILAADESSSTLGKRLVKEGLTNDIETRRAYREVLFSNESLGEYLSGAILNIETLTQRHSNGSLFVDVLSKKRIVPGVKADTGLMPLERNGIISVETMTMGLEDLLERSVEYRSLGARFTKWRGVLRLDKAAQLPSYDAIEINAAQLANYAAKSQAAGLVPIIEPELLIEGSHTAEEFAETMELILGGVYFALAKAKVHLEGTLLKPQMAMAGLNCPMKHTRSELVRLTLAFLRRRVPPAVPGIVFLSGGQSEEDATLNLNSIARAAGVGKNGDQSQRHLYPWSLSFSFGRSLQASVLHAWASGEGSSKAIEIAGLLARANALAQQGNYTGPHPSIMGQKKPTRPESRMAAIRNSNDN
mmetsp:Transcript_5970/g.8986  ORF Transcript_5970/g.8986 Transcript_5970/m.8986 type:complete len:403 (-) Transcript_5970:109-1317(-)|eukprot:CAMPEP_0171452180 /NCGR_PEP_ID=MMETSP0945-20130129/387_1 /TAXON_ID=109269 /ORGANISM="Vaucheria litorea, Strain CCMP2940" /LENGTH=402 /DNA_ID=CAMNT_0011976787 /DNA_START=168 /DNA_END=1376 /DNA_ORIENTATION=+